MYAVLTIRALQRRMHPAVTSRETTDQGTPGKQEDFNSQEMEDFHWCAIDASRIDIWHETVHTHDRRANWSSRSRSLN